MPLIIGLNFFKDVLIDQGSIEDYKENLEPSIRLDIEFSIQALINSIHVEELECPTDRLLDVGFDLLQKKFVAE